MSSAPDPNVDPDTCFGPHPRNIGTVGQAAYKRENCRVDLDKGTQVYQARTRSLAVLPVCSPVMRNALGPNTHTSPPRWGPYALRMSRYTCVYVHSEHGSGRDLV